ncbi:MAG: MGMT family protein [Oscillospiraceae bacterium]|nr:MGMT family protein [Oscillospiraceae bacterium]
MKLYQEIYKIVAEIPKGKVMTYGQVARSVGNPRWARLVGQAMFNAPEFDVTGRIIPCHRVLNCKGEMSPGYAFGGQDIQRKMLKDEGIIFKPNGCVDLKKSGL